MPHPAFPWPLPTLRLLAATALLVATAALASAESAQAGKGRQGDRQPFNGATKIGVGQGRRVAPIGCKARMVRRYRRAIRIPASAQRQRVARRGHTRQRRLLRARIQRRCDRQQPATKSSTPYPVYWGAAIGDHLTGEQAPWNMEAVAQFEATAGKKMSLIHFFAPFANCASSCWYYDFPTTPMESIREHGAIPFFSWSSQSIPSSLTQPDFQLSDVISGSHDEYIREFAEEASEWGHPFFLRFNWEMNGDWFSWSEGVNGNQPGEYVAAWRHVRDIFTSVGATNATWVWCPNVDPEGKYQDLASLYPGDVYVDWTCLDGYNWGTQPGAQSERLDFERLFGSTYSEVATAIAPDKPMAIGETGASERSGGKAEWIADMLSHIPTDYPQIRALVWFNKYDDGMDWPIETSADSASAFAGGIQNPFYRDNGYSSIAASPIPPPS